MDDLVVQALSQLMPGDVRRGELPRHGRTLRWVEAGSGSPTVVFDAALGEPGSLAWAGVMPLVAARTRVLAYDRAGIGVSDPMSPLTLAAQVDDLTEVLRQAGNGPCVVVGHSWGGLLAQLVALDHPDLVAGLVLVDPAEEKFLASLPSGGLQHGITLGETILEQHARGELAATVRDIFGDFARQLTQDQQLQALILDAYVWCYASRSQAAMVRDEHRLVAGSLASIGQRRTGRALPDVPVVVFSATTGRPAPERDMWTGCHAQLAASVPGARHIVLADTNHAVNQERPAEIAETVIHMTEDIRHRPFGLRLPRVAGQDSR
ncbi:MAG: alpha/beta hydrolase [Streptosporangiaceae bacterium]|jgi:pimeloyl-ACP methyl ester carboxylesterase